MSQTNAQTEKLVAEGARRLLTRATDSRALDAVILTKRLGAALDKYVLKDDPRASSQTVNEFFDLLHADDLCLIVACEQGDERAWSDLVEQYGATVKSAARKAAGNEDAAEDVAQSIWAELHGLRVRADGRASGKIAYYSGRGSLGGWLRAVVAQLAVDQHRKQSRLVQTEDDADFDRMARDTSNASAREENAWGAHLSPVDPERALVEKRGARDVETALAKAIGELAAEDRLLIKLYYFDELRLREAGAVLGVHEATASRRLARVHQEVRQRVEMILMNERGWTKAETTRSLAEACAHLDADLQIMLTSEGASVENQSGRGETL